MSLHSQYLEWDSRFFGVRCAQMQGGSLDAEALQVALQQAREQRVDCLYYLADPVHIDGIRLLEKSEFHLVDVRLTFGIQSWTDLKHAGFYPKHNLFTAAEKHIPALRQIALTSYENTRFLNDPCFEHDRARELYAAWIENSVRGYADQVLAAALEDQLAGFISLHLPKDRPYGSIGLVGVAETARGQGIGRQLVQEALKWFHHNEVDRVQVVTQASNPAAQRLYQRSGFELVSSGLWYHKWFEEDC